MTNNKLGRPTLSKNELTVNVSVALMVSQVEWLKAYGFGNVSLGIRRLVDERKEPKKG